MSTSMENSSAGTPAGTSAGSPAGASAEGVDQHEPTFIRRPLDNCPQCGSWQLSPVVDADGGLVHFLCGSCNRCWHVAFGYVRRVQPEACAACPQTETCAAAYAKDHTSA
jgi:hypothetical protein